jgi:primosomal protein N' (replication factor Y)
VSTQQAGRGDQLALVRSRVRAARPKPPPEPAADQPVARVAVDVALPHLDRPFDYLVPDALADAARPGARVRVRFAGQLVDGFVLERTDASAHGGRLSFLARVVSPEPVLSPAVARLARLVADRYAGSLADVLRLAVPPRHAAAERAARSAAPEQSAPQAGPREPGTPEPGTPEPGTPGPGAGGWEPYVGGPALLAALADGRAPRAVWTALPGADWPAALAAAAAATLAGGRGSLLVVPDGRDVARLDAALAARLGAGHHLVLTADLGPAERYRRFLTVMRGTARVVVGTRAAMFAPVRDLGLLAVWDDGDDLHAEPRAPYPHVREVLALRSVEEDAGLLLGGHACSAEAAQLVASGWARPVAAARATVRAAAARVEVAGEEAELARDPAARSARLPTVAWRAAHDGLTRGPVLVQVPRRGYLPALACAGCRSAARCPACRGPLAAPGAHGPPGCRWCGAVAGGWECPHCGGRRLRAVVVGARRTAEELGRAFPRAVVRTSGRDGVLAAVGPEPALVVATPGAEPVAAGGYAAALLLDGWALLSRPDLRAGEEALRRWLAAAALVRPASEAGRVVVLADPGSPAVQALVRWDPASFAQRELAERATLRLPPAARLASLTGQPAALRDFVQALSLPPLAELLGPVPAGPPGPTTRPPGDGARPANRPGRPGDGTDPPADERLLVRVPAGTGRELAVALRAAAGVRSARKDVGPVRVQVDPLEVA